MSNRISRRRFLHRTALGTGAASVFGPPALLADRAPNSKLATAVIGCGGRGEVSLNGALSEKLVAIADVDDARLGAASRKAASQGERPLGYYDYRRMFDELHKDIDVVFVATPDHHHAPASLRAIHLGKHVFCEKPLCHDVAEARALAKAAAQHKVTTMMGNQGHCNDGYRLLCEYLWAGAIGDVIEAHSWSGFVNGGAGGRPAAKPVPAGLHWDQWLGVAPYRDYHDGLHPAYWRFYRDFGTGGLGDWGCHNMDGVFWALDTGSPASVECLGTIGGGADQHPQASAIRWTVPARGTMPPLKVHWYDGAQLKLDAQAGAIAGKLGMPNYPPMLAKLEKEGDCSFREGFDGGTFYIGTKGVMHTGCYGQRPRILPEKAHAEFPVPPQRIPRIKGTPFDHFFECCRAGKPTCADFGYAAALTEFLLLGLLSVQAGPGTNVEWDSPGMRCTNLPELNARLGRKCREGWGF
jgi:predicted dehydrogenase